MKRTRAVWVLFLGCCLSVQAQSARPYVESEMYQARDYLDQRCQEFFRGDCRAVFDGEKLILQPRAGLADCLRSMDKRAAGCPGDYTKQGAIRQLEVMRKRAVNIARGLKIEVYVDGKAYSTAKRR